MWKSVYFKSKNDKDVHIGWVILTFEASYQKFRKAVKAGAVTYIDSYDLKGNVVVGDVGTVVADSPEAAKSLARARVFGE